MPDPQYIEVSARTGHGMQAWLDWLTTQEARVAPDHYAKV